MSDLPPISAIELALVDYAKETCTASRVDVRWIGVEERMLPADIDRIAWTGDACRNRPELRVSFNGSAGRTSVTVRPQLALWQSVPVAIEDIPSGTPISASQLADVPWEKLRGTPMTTGVSKRLIKAGDPLDSTVVMVPMDIERDQSVSLRVSRGSLTITAPGRTLQSARVGEKVKVINEATRVALEGTLIDSQTVELP